MAKDNDDMPRRVKDSKECAASYSGHIWGTFERIVNGAHTKLTLCKNCGHRP